MIHQCYLKTVICNTILTFAMSNSPLPKAHCQQSLNKSSLSTPYTKTSLQQPLDKSSLSTTSDQNIVNISRPRVHCQHLLTKTTLSTHPVKTTLSTPIPKRSLSMTKLTRTLWSTFCGQDLTVTLMLLPHWALQTTVGMLVKILVCDKIVTNLTKTTMPFTKCGEGNAGGHKTSS